MRGLLIAFVLLLANVSIALAATVQMHVTRMSPSRDFTLPRYSTLYIEVSYHSALPVRFQARAFAQGQSVDAGQAMNPSIVHPAGDGSALVWVSFREPASIDQVRVTAYDEQWHPLATLPITQSIRWLPQSAKHRQQRPDWVQALVDADEQIDREYRQAHPPAPDPVGDFLATLVFVSVPGYLLLQGASLLTQHGRWRLASLVPLLIMVPAAVYAIFALSAGSNLWPLVFIFASPIGFLYLVGLFFVRGLGTVWRLV